jgi:ataxia telangiectasia mutated family protein
MFFASLIIQPVQQTLLMHHRPVASVWCILQVIPFTPSAGVLEWVNGTVPLLEYLLGSTRAGGAHGRYGAGDWTFMACREHMSTETDKRRAYQTVCSNFRPVLHNFFLERFAQAADWFEKRLAYTRSVATSSMVGYIVGLGDRHSMNILLDQASAEVVHIDLGVAFEQGLMLKTPERVPFRLTREIIDGMGVSGVEGIFRRCCEATLSVMRTNKEALLTIIEVFIYDPLYKWALSPLKALERQQEMVQTVDESEGIHDADMQAEGNQDAARALLRVKQKLDGYEEGEMRSLQGQVQQLIQDAQDPERLSHMFPGWGAWL